MLSAPTFEGLMKKALSFMINNYFSGLIEDESSFFLLLKDR